MARGLPEAAVLSPSARPSELVDSIWIEPAVQALAGSVRLLVRTRTAPVAASPLVETLPALARRMRPPLAAPVRLRSPPDTTWTKPAAGASTAAAA